MGPVETEWLSNGSELVRATNYLPGAWIDRSPSPDRKIRLKIIGLEIGQLRCPTHGGRRAPPTSHFGCPAITLFRVRTSSAILKAMQTLNKVAGNVHSAHGWRDVLEHVGRPVTGSQCCGKPYVSTRTMPLLASPDLYAVHGSRGLQVAIRLKANAVLQESIVTSADPPRWSPGQPCSLASHAQLQLSGRFVEQQAPGGSPRSSGMPPAISAVPGFIVTNLSRPAERVTKFQRQRAHSGAAKVLRTRSTGRGCHDHSFRGQRGAVFSCTPWPTTWPTSCEHWLCRPGRALGQLSLREKLVKIGAKVVSHGRLSPPSTSGGRRPKSPVR